jgi:hypothetical protein
MSNGRSPSSIRARVLLVASLSAAPLLLAAAEAEFPSLWRTREIVVDGADEDWAGRLVPIPDTPVTLGVQNDAKFLYICLRTSDETMMKRIRAQGVTFYIDPDGGTGKTHGVRYPAPPELPPTGAGGGDDGGAPRLRRPASPDELEILGPPGTEVRRLKLADAKPAAAALGERGDTLVLELKLPLASGVNAPFAVSSAPGKTISLGLEGAPPGGGDHRGHSRSGSGDEEAPPEGGRGGGTYGSGGGGRGGYGGSGGYGGFGGYGHSSGGGHWGHGGGSGHSRGERPADGAASLRFWFQVTLSSPPGPSSGAAAPRD